jgi:hypothetical protein
LFARPKALEKFRPANLAREWRLIEGGDEADGARMTAQEIDQYRGIEE